MRCWGVLGKSMSSLKEKYENSKLSGVIGVFGKSVVAFLKGCYPILVYYLIIGAVVFVSGLIFGSGKLWGSIVEAAGTVVAIPYLRYVFRKDVLLRAYGIRTRQNVEKKERVLRYLYGAASITVVALAMNNILGYLPLDRISTAYQKVSEELYAGPVLVQILCLGFVVPYGEELLFRGVILGRLKDAFGAQKAIIISAVLFGVVHGNLVQLIYAGIVGLALAYFADKHQSLWPAYLGHCAANLFAIAVQNGVFPVPESFLLRLLGTIILVVAASSLFGLQFKVERLK